MSGKEKTNRSWGGRFSQASSDLMQRYTDSQHFDRLLYAEDIAGSMAHAAMLGETGIIPLEEASEIIRGLQLVREEIDAGKFVWKEELEDVHMNIESRLVELIGDTGKKLHTGRSRNDQVALSFRLYVSGQCEKWIQHCLELCFTLKELAERHQTDILPGFTHLQPAQPVALAQHFLAYCAMFARDVERLEDALKRVRVSPLGAAALAGSTFPLDPGLVASRTGFDRVFTNSMDAVSDRDFALECLFASSLVMMHLSRLCEELIIWANPAFAFLLLPDEFSSGSSIMPQKKNPDVAELMRGKTGRVYGNLVALLTIMKGLPLAYNRDLQEDKEAFFDSSQTVLASLEIMTAMLKKLRFNTQKMREACKKGFLNATELADYLARRGVPFRKAHEITGNIVAYAESLNMGLEDLSLEDFAKFSTQIGEDVFDVLSYEACVKRRESPGGTGPKSISRQLAQFDKWLQSKKAQEGSWKRFYDNGCG